MGLTDKHLAYGDDIPQTQTEKDYYWKINCQQSCDDCISRQEALNAVHKYFEHYLQLNDDICLDGLRSLPSVIPKEKTGHCKDCKWWKDNDGVYRRGVNAESNCPINARTVYEGNGYCFMFEPQESEVKE